MKLKTETCFLFFVPVVNVWTFESTHMLCINSNDEHDRHEHVYNVEIHVNDKETINTLFSNHVEFFHDLGYSFTFNETWESDEGVEELFHKIQKMCDFRIQLKRYQDNIFRNINGDCESKQNTIDINEMLCELRSQPEKISFDIFIASPTMVDMNELIKKKMSIKALGKRLNWNEIGEKERLDIIAFPLHWCVILLYYFIAKIPLLSSCKMEFELVKREQQ